jgi:hypothetical protein
MNDYIDAYEAASEDYSNFGPLWAEMVFPDDFEALQALYGGRDVRKDSNNRNYDDGDKSHTRRR